ncbi:MAG: hypothetical protein LBG06_01380 [Deltaproteobacteria bacterium]|nr:hypothetical protein [Deltaproteobacteria bacterium]
MEERAFEEAVEPAIRVRERGGRLLAAGGAVRDFALRSQGRVCGRLPGAGDLDLVAFGLSLDGLREALGPLGEARTAFRREGGGGDGPRIALVLLKRRGVRLEIGLPKTARPPSAPGAPVVPLTPESLARDASLRDFTVNALYLDPLEGALLDPLGGLADLEAGRIALCSPGALSDDPVRMLRAMSLVCRRPLVAGADLLAETRRQAWKLGEAPPERLWPEWRTLAGSPRPHLGLHFLAESGLIALFPALDALRDLPQYPHYHPEGSVWNHTVLVVQAMSGLPLPDRDRRERLVLTALLHDVGKATAARAVRRDGDCSLVLYPDHAALGAPAARGFLRSIEAPERVIRPVVKLTARHMDSAFKTLSRARLRWIARELAPDADLEDFWAVTVADWNGRRPWPEPYPWSLEEFLEPVGGETGPPPDLVSGRDLLVELGVPEGPEVGRLLQLVRQESDEGRISSREAALAFLAGRPGCGGGASGPLRGASGGARS